MRLTQKALASLLVVIAIAVETRVAAMLLEPLLPWLYIVAAAMAVVWLLTSWRQR